MTSIPEAPQHEASPSLFANHPSTDYSKLIVRYPYQRDVHFAIAYHEGARRLAGTYSGEPIGDTILMPVMFLYRQAFELQLKVTLRSLAKWQRTFVDSSDATLTSEAVDKRIKNVLRHKLGPLLDEVLTHWAALDLDEAFPAGVESLIRAMHEADEPGTGFRYSGGLPDSQDNIDFHSLIKEFDDNFQMLCSALDYVDEGYSAVPRPDEY